MAKVDIPFKKRFESALCAGVKTCTSRTKRMGEIGDVFESFGEDFMIMDIKLISLWWIAYFLYYNEGCESPEEFIEIWDEIHPVKGFDPSQIVHVHFFLPLGLGIEVEKRLLPR